MNVLTKNVPELERSTWMHVVLVTPENRIVNIELDPDEVMNCFEDECMQDIYDVYVKPVTGCGYRSCSWYIAKGAKVLKYLLESGECVYVIAHRVDVDPAKLSRGLAC
ncbi:MAG: hypothetical protein DRO12_04170 [Thermoprotei archaeon]|nr:MAG: hypothetical protein DRO12_04170 [Thermoprotei archaeon]